MDNCKVAVCIPAYNRAHFLSQALYSLCDQGLNKDQYAVAISDDASSDHTEEVIESFRGRLQIIYKRNPKNIGHIANFELATTLCETPYISFLPDDDLIAPGQLGRALSVFEKHPDIALVSSLIVVQEWPGSPNGFIHGMFLDANGETTYAQNYAWNATEWLSLALVQTPLSMIGSIFQKSAFNKCNLWKSYPLWHDRLMLAEMGLHGNVMSLPWIGGYYRLSNQQLSSRLASNHANEFIETTEVILDICKSRNIPVLEYWMTKICRSTPLERIRFLRMLHRALPVKSYEYIKRSCEARLGLSLNLGFRLDKLGVPAPIKQLLRKIDSSLTKSLS